MLHQYYISTVRVLLGMAVTELRWCGRRYCTFMCHKCLVI